MHQKSTKVGRSVQRRGEAKPERERDEAPRAQHDTEGLGQESLLLQALASANMVKAWQRVKANRGSAGVDGLSIAETAQYLKRHWPEIREAILNGSYRPAPVRRVQIAKPTGGMRELGIPTVTDRLIQQALLQIVQPIIDPRFCEHSYGFRPGRRAHQAVQQARRYVQAGYRVVVDVDLEKFFDRVNHDILMHRLSKHIEEPALLRLVRRYLEAGIMDEGVVMQRHEGTPQGGPLSPLLANVLLDEVDRELERRGHRFVRYADDCNVYVRSPRAGERVLSGLRRLYARLHLKINEAKSAVASALKRKFLGYAFWHGPGGEVRCRVAPQALANFKQRIREMTRRSSGRSMPQIAEQLRGYVPGWKRYFELARTPKLFAELDGWIRHRLRALQLKHWRRGTTMYRELKALGAQEADARAVAANSRCWWRNARMRLNRALPIAYFDRLGVPRLS